MTPLSHEQAVQNAQGCINPAGVKPRFPFGIKVHVCRTCRKIVYARNPKDFIIGCGHPLEEATIYNWDLATQNFAKVRR